MTIRFLGGVLIFVLFFTAAPAHDLLKGAKVYHISQAEIAEAMRPETAYDITVTSNAARLQANVILRLVRSICAGDSSRHLLFIDHRDWFRAFLQRTGLTAETVPYFSQIANQMKQDQWIEYAPGKIVQNVKNGRAPEFALNVFVCWQKEPGVPEFYTFEDTLASPKLRIKNRRLLSYRLLDFSDMIVYDEITGFYGKPISGILGFLFRLIGDGQIVHSRLIQLPDGLLVAKTKAVKGFFISRPQVTIDASGKMENGINLTSTDSEKVRKRLDEPIQLVYGPMLDERRLREYKK